MACFVIVDGRAVGIRVRNSSGLPAGIQAVVEGSPEPVAGHWLPCRRVLRAKENVLLAKVQRVNALCIYVLQINVLDENVFRQGHKHRSPGMI
ncbi:MAG: hypothetical protein CSB48_00065 [Proteobacteria bacterium]|nr:MAG: hypothetical protein CSB48_00065 [Pseudomonadota bacterium]